MKCNTCFWLANIPEYMDPCYSCKDYNKYEEKELTDGKKGGNISLKAKQTPTTNKEK